MQTSLLDSLHLIACSHDSHDAAGRRCLDRLVQRISELTGSEVLHASVSGREPTLAELAQSLPTRRSGVVMPLLLSTGYDLDFQLRRAAAGFRDRSETAGEDPVSELQVCGSLGPSVRLARLQVRRLEEAGYRAGDAVILGATGVTVADGLAAAEQQQAYLQSLLGVPVGLGYGSSAASPSIEEAVQKARLEGAERVAIVSYLLASGPLQDRLAEAEAEVLTTPLLQTDRDEEVEVVAELAISRAVDYVRKFLPASVS